MKCTECVGLDQLEIKNMIREQNTGKKRQGPGKSAENNFATIASKQNKKK